MANRRGVKPLPDPCGQCPVMRHLEFIETRLSRIEEMLREIQPPTPTRRGPPPPGIGQQGLVDALPDDRPTTRKDTRNE